MHAGADAGYNCSQVDCYGERELIIDNICPLGLGVRVAGGLNTVIVPRWVRVPTRYHRVGAARTRGSGVPCAGVGLLEVRFCWDRLV